MPEAEARRLAAREGLSLIPGFRATRSLGSRAFTKAVTPTPYRAEIKRDGEHHALEIDVEKVNRPRLPRAAILLEIARPGYHPAPL